MEAIIYSLLSNDATITSLVSKIVATVPDPDKTNPPYLVYTRNNTTPDYLLGGPSGLTNYELQIDYWAVKSTDCYAIGDAVQDLLSGHIDEDIHSCLMTSRNQVEEEFRDGHIHHGTQIYSLWT